MTASAAFFRVEGCLLSKPTSFTVAWYALHAQHVGSRFFRLGTVGLSMASKLADPVVGRRLQWSALRGMSEDRLAFLGEELWEMHLLDALRPVGIDLVERARAEGRRIVLVSDNLDVVVEHLARHLEVDDWRSNRMEMRNRRATGRLQDPIVSTFSGTELSEWADEHGVSLRSSLGYGALSEDAVLLSAVGRPCAVEPDRTLRRLANEHGWPVVNA